ncbi:MAG: LpqN/LpqT family lipoprotein [Mycolicibacterium neoaurum]|uniref:LpqN/LpqT family lipoprotein n=1 Tax=Mycolicibacterium neoaurum TaxID=1795 RepID=UPI002FF732E3
MLSTHKFAAVVLVSVAVTVAASGCSGKSDAPESSTSSSATSSSGSASSTSAKAQPATKTPVSTPSEVAGPNRTIGDYVAENGITETVIRRGDPGPVIDLPVPDGWEPTDELGDVAPYGAIVYTSSAVPDNPPRILAILSKLTGNVDPAEVLELASGELNNIPGFDGPEQGARSSLGGFDAVALGGHYDADGTQGMIAQKTVVIPGQDGLYVLQLNAYSAESESEILTTATDLVDNQTTISP